MKDYIERETEIVGPSDALANVINAIAPEILDKDIIAENPFIGDIYCGQEACFEFGELFLIARPGRNELGIYNRMPDDEDDGAGIAACWLGTWQLEEFSALSPEMIRHFLKSMACLIGAAEAHGFENGSRKARADVRKALGL